MGSQIVLEYPNGRTHATAVSWKVEAGAEFELYGRRWQAVGPVLDWSSRTRWRRGLPVEPQQILCKSISAGVLTS